MLMVVMVMVVEKEFVQLLLGDCYGEGNFVILGRSSSSINS